MSPMLVRLIGMLVIAASAAAYAEPPRWTLDPSASRLNIVSIKNNAVSEVHHFTDVEGAVGADGQAIVEVGLASVETGVPIRDERMRDMLFETAMYPSARLTLPVDAAAVEALAVGAHLLLEADAMLDLHGMSGSVPVSVRITRIADGRWLATSEKPVIVNAASFGLTDGIEALRRIVDLQSIGAGVPVTFALTFTKGGAASSV